MTGRQLHEALTRVCGCLCVDGFLNPLSSPIRSVHHLLSALWPDLFFVHRHSPSVSQTDTVLCCDTHPSLNLLYTCASSKTVKMIEVTREW
jgi:hypothetical protein